MRRPPEPSYGRAAWVPDPDDPELIWYWDGQRFDDAPFNRQQGSSTGLEEPSESQDWVSGLGLAVATVLTFLVGKSEYERRGVEDPWGAVGGTLAVLAILALCLVVLPALLRMLLRRSFPFDLLRLGAAAMSVLAVQSLVGTSVLTPPSPTPSSFTAPAPSGVLTALSTQTPVPTQMATPTEPATAAIPPEPSAAEVLAKRVRKWRDDHAKDLAAYKREMQLVRGELPDLATETPYRADPNDFDWTITVTWLAYHTGSAMNAAERLAANCPQPAIKLYLEDIVHYLGLAVSDIQLAGDPGIFGGTPGEHVRQMLQNLDEARWAEEHLMAELTKIG